MFFNVRVSLFLLVLLLAGPAAKAQQSLGLRLGVPTALTYKRFVEPQNAVELLIGSHPQGQHHRYYSRAFNRNNGSRVYVNNDLRSSLYLQGRYLLHTDLMINGLDGNLSWYWGGGVFLRTARVTYTYQEDNVIATRDDFDLDLGPEVIAGLEYDFQHLPIQVFLELSMVIEIADRPLGLQVPGGGGVRYRF